MREEYAAQAADISTLERERERETCIVIWRGGFEEDFEFGRI